MSTLDHVDEQPAVTALRRKDLLGIAELSPAEISLILDTAEAMKEVGTRPIKKVPALRGKTVINLFFEPSTRTRTSFEIAEKRLSADTLNIAIGNVERGQGRDAGRHRAEPRGDVAGHDRAAALVLGRLAPAVADLPVGDHQRRRRDARTPDPGAARRLHHSRAAEAPRRPQGRHRRRPAAQPRAALEHPAADEDGRGRLGLRTADADSGRHRRHSA